MELVCTKHDKNTKQTNKQKPNKQNLKKNSNQKKNSLYLNSPPRGKLCGFKLLLTGNSNGFLSNTEFRNVIGCYFKIWVFCLKISMLHSCVKQNTSHFTSYHNTRHKHYSLLKFIILRTLQKYMGSQGAISEVGEQKF